MTQTDLFDPPLKKEQDGRLEAIGADLVRLLEDQRRWVTVEQLRNLRNADNERTARTDEEAKPVSRDTIRHAIATTRGRITSGQKGVRLTRLTTREEHAAAVATMTAQITGLNKRRSEMIKAFHGAW
jgi:gluconate kinase